MTRLFRNSVRIGVIHRLQYECPGTDIKIRVLDLFNVHQLLTIESGHPIYRPQNLFAAQVTKMLVADESNEDLLLYEAKWETIQDAVKSLVRKHYQYRTSTISEVFVVDWWMNRATIIEVSYSGASKAA